MISFCTWRHWIRFSHNRLMSFIGLTFHKSTLHQSITVNRVSIYIRLKKLEFHHYALANELLCYNWATTTSYGHMILCTMDNGIVWPSWLTCWPFMAYMLTVHGLHVDRSWPTCWPFMAYMLTVHGLHVDRSWLTCWPFMAYMLTVHGLHVFCNLAKYIWIN